MKVHEVISHRLTRRTATVAVVGLGEVGLPLLVAAGSEGFELIGIDGQDNIARLKAGVSYVDGIDDGQLADVAAATLDDGFGCLHEADIIVLTGDAATGPVVSGGGSLEQVAETIAADLHHGQLLVIDTADASDAASVLSQLRARTASERGGVALRYERRVSTACETVTSAARRIVGLSEHAARVASEFYATLCDGPASAPLAA